jgi:NAD(P)-dependent dehydrogenase (short-subunit alcohol dehydrogenase family)
VTDGDEVANAIGRIGAIDILINNAGIPETTEPAQFVDMTSESWRQYVDLNLYGVLHCTDAVVGGMCERGWGRVITISSGLGVIGLNVGMSLYAAGKGGAIAFMRHLAIEVADKGVTANTLALGPMERPRPGPETEVMTQRVPVGRLGKPDDVGFLCVYLASPEASWITGQTVHINGGEITT